MTAANDGLLLVGVGFSALDASPLAFLTFLAMLAYENPACASRAGFLFFGFSGHAP